MAPGGLKQLKQTGSRLTPCFCLAKKFIIIKEVLLGCKEKFVAEEDQKLLILNLANFVFNLSNCVSFFFQWHVIQIEGQATCAVRYVCFCHLNNLKKVSIKIAKYFYVMH